jgi:hypothetical protein
MHTKLKLFRIENKIKNLQEAVIAIVNKFFKENKK